MSTETKASCPKCGVWNPSSTFYCESCGARLAPEVPKSPAPVVMPSAVPPPPGPGGLPRPSVPLLVPSESRGSGSGEGGGLRGPAAVRAAPTTRPVAGRGPGPTASRTLAVQGMMGIGAAALIGGALLPWVTASAGIFSLSKAGYEGDGIFTGAIGVILLLGALLGKGKPGARFSVAGAILAVIAGLIGAYDLLNVSAKVAEISAGSVAASVGAGLYVTLLGAILGLVGGLQSVPEAG